MSQPPPPPGYQAAPMYQPPPPNSSKATTSLVLGIVSLIACGLLLGIPAMIVARQAKREIAESGGRIGGEGYATAGFVTGLIGTIWSVVAFVLVIVVFAFGASFINSCTTTTDSNGDVSTHCGDS